MRLICSVALLGLICTTACSGTTAREATNANDIQQISERLAAYDRANDAGDLDSLMTLFADDAVMMVPDQAPIVGKPAIREVISGWLSSRCTSKHEPIETESFGEVVISRGNATGTCPTTGSAPATTYNNKYLHIYRHQSDGSLRYWQGAFNANVPMK